MAIISLLNTILLKELITYIDLISNIMPTRCVNIDWLEVHCREPQDQCLNAAFYISHGYFVKMRDYGTRVYREMFTIYGEDGRPFIEVRRNPASQGLNGIHDPEECHLRLVNRACYFNNAANKMLSFLNMYHYERVRISRIDICLDFDSFDKGDKPREFVRRYLQGKYAKINQGNIAVRGTDTWSGQDWNSVSWGSTASQVSTKLYNKTRELYDLKTGVFAKPYILQAWKLAGYIDNDITCTKDGELIDMWRLEFSLTSPKINWLKLELNGKQREYQSLRHELSTYDSRAKLLIMFASLTMHYFRFKYYEPDQRKDRCKDKVLFVWSDAEEVYKVQRDDYAFIEDNKPNLRWIKLISLLMDYKSQTFDYSLRKAADEILESIQYKVESISVVNPWSKKELEEFNLYMTNRIEELGIHEFVLSNQIRDILRIKDRTHPKFKPSVKNENKEDEN